MKQIKLILFSLAALAFARPAGLTTANAADDPKAPLPPEFQKQLDDQAAEIAALKQQIGKPPTPPEDTSLLAALCKGSGVEMKDVRWRVQAGLDPEQAVAAAAAQRDFDASKAEAAAKASKSKASK